MNELTDEEIRRQEKLKYETRRECMIEDASNIALAGLCVYACWKVYSGIGNFIFNHVRDCRSKAEISKEEKKLQEEKYDQDMKTAHSLLTTGNNKSTGVKDMEFLRSGVFHNLDDVLN